MFKKSVKLGSALCDLSYSAITLPHLGFFFSLSQNVTNVHLYPSLLLKHQSFCCNFSIYNITYFFQNNLTNVTKSLNFVFKKKLTVIQLSFDVNVIYFSAFKLTKTPKILL